VYADDAVRTLRSKGFRANRLQDGFPEWADAGRTVSTGATEGGRR
jgi:ArsR family transcriptional regulator